MPKPIPYDPHPFNVHHDVFDVRKYGAKGDAIRDDTVAIQRAITAAEAATGIVYFPPGWYLYTTLTISARVTLRGDTLGISYLSKTLTTGDGIKLNVGSSSKIYGVTVQELVLGASTNLVSGALLRLGNVGFCNVRDVDVTGSLGGAPFEGFRVSNASDSHFSGTRVQACLSHGVAIQPDSATSIIVEVHFDAMCESRANGGDGYNLLMDVAYSEGVCSLEGIHIEGITYNNTKSGVRLYATVTGAEPRNIHIGGSHDSNAGTSTTAATYDAGISCYTTDAGAQIRRLQIDLGKEWVSFNANDGIYLNDVRDFSIQGSGVRGSAGHGINIQNSAEGVVDVARIQSNSRAADNTSYALNVGGCDAIDFRATLDNTNDLANGQRGFNTGGCTNLDLSHLQFHNIEVATVPRINGLMDSGETGMILPKGEFTAVKSGNYTVANLDDVVRCDTTAAGFTVTLPRAANFPNREITVKRTAGANTVTIGATAGSVETTSCTTAPIRHRSDGTNWIDVG